MSRILLPLSSLLILASVLVAIPAPAQAGSAFSFSVSDGDRHRSGHDYRGRNHRDYSPRFHHSEYRHSPYHWQRSVVRNVYLPPIYVAPAPRVVYAQPVRYVSNTSMLANAASPTYTNNWGQVCREYQTKSWIGGSLEETYGTACLQDDGAWRVVD